MTEPGAWEDDDHLEDGGGAYVFVLDEQRVYRATGDGWEPMDHYADD